MRRDGHSTQSLIEQLSKRMRDAAARRAWGDEEENAGLRREGSDKAARRLHESKSGNGAPPHSASKKRRVGDDPPGLSPFSAGRFSHTNALSHPMTPPDLGGVFPGVGLAEAFDHAGAPMAPTAQPEGKRSREEAAPLGQFKKLKLRPHGNPES